jgi:hypothetical protein
MVNSRRAHNASASQNRDAHRFRRLAEGIENTKKHKSKHTEQWMAAFRDVTQRKTVLTPGVMSPIFGHQHPTLT